MSLYTEGEVRHTFVLSTEVNELEGKEETRGARRGEGEGEHKRYPILKYYDNLGAPSYPMRRREQIEKQVKCQLESYMNGTVFRKEEAEQRREIRIYFVSRLSSKAE